jgi:hypothetical protein
MWSSNLKEGPGVLTLASGDTYEGQFKQDKKHGRGKFCWGEVRLGFVFRWLTACVGAARGHCAGLGFRWSLSSPLWIPVRFRCCAFPMLTAGPMCEPRAPGKDTSTTASGIWIGWRARVNTLPPKTLAPSTSPTLRGGRRQRDQEHLESLHSEGGVSSPSDGSPTL